MNDYINENADIFNDEKPKKGFTIKKLLKFIGIALIVLIYAILFVRCATSSNHKVVKEVLMDDTFLAAYNGNPSEFCVQQYAMKSAWVAIRENRLVEFNYLYYIPAARQMQFSVKFNTDLPECNYDGDIPFRFRLVDGDGNEYTDYYYKYAEKFGYGYIRLCFNGIDFVKDGVNDETGKPVRNTYKLIMDMVGKDGIFSELCDYGIYDGSSVCKNVKFKMK